MKVVLTVFLLLDVILLACTAQNSTIVEPTSEVEILESPFGNCTARQIWKIHTTCHTPLIVGMQKKKEAMPLVEQMVKCKFNLYNKSKCFELHDIQGSFGEFLNATLEDVRERAGMIQSRPVYQIDKVKGGGTWILFPCSISKDKYVEELKKCNSKMQAMWKNDTADPRICREYYNTKQCQKQLFDTKCNYTGETKISNDLLFGSYNPFCPGGVDITSGTTFCKPFGTIALTTILLLAILLGQQ
ncbi:uncharacterized protein LOC116301600 isoform X2 [Actinia tenebrosa]|uniref:Uncharacterized protein LOC116301600 isoform X2 n=1 Tax=Actinia tenebrosa TaxID=6105 RepID=A0A6P8IIP8_ACTTE|nr:uncharacterized protein LOC116301600 isoform X2 [Actinia tenebrosa]